MRRSAILKPHAFIFDMDGVLVDSEYWWPRYEHEFFSRVIPQWKRSYLNSIVGKSLKDIHTHFRQRFNLRMRRDEFFNVYDKMAQEVYGNKVRLMPNALRTLKVLFQKNFILGLASSSRRHWIDQVVHRFGLGGYFAKTISADAVDMRGKPEPDIYLYAAKQLNVAPAQAIAVEDSQAGIASAKAAGMYVVGYQTAHNKKQNLKQADSVVHNLYTIARFFV